MKKVAPLVAFAALDSIFLVVAFMAGYYVRSAAAGNPALRLPIPGIGSGDRYPLLTEVRELLEARFIEPLPDGKTLEYGAVRGLVGALGDPYTVFIEPQSHELETQSLQGEFGGVGVGLSKNADGEIVLSPLPDSPAAQVGLLEGDVLLAVDGVRIGLSATTEQATALIRGPVGTTVTLRVRHVSGAELAVSIVRQRIELPSATWRIVDGTTGIGLIVISRFSDKTPGEVLRALDELQAQGAARFILDLRNNGGGILESAVEVASQFLDGGVVLYETQRDAPEKVYSARAASGLGVSAPVAVLVNHNTASAAEIVAGALLDSNRAPLIGQTTYGKGSVQLVYELSDGSSLHVTAHLWYTPDRRQLQGHGLSPTYAVEPTADGTDAELKYAVQYLQSIP